MTNTSDEYWDVDGHSLQTYAHNIQSWGGDRQAPPELRGDDITVPFTPGDLWVEKVPDSRVVTLGMWINGCNEDGTIPVNASAQEKVRANWYALRRLLWTPRRQVILTKRFRPTVFDSPITVSAKAQYASGLVPSMSGAGRATFTVDMKLADPFFYGKEEQVVVTKDTPVSVLVPGDERTYAISVDFQGTLVNPKLTNKTPDIPVWFKYGASTGANTAARIEVQNFRAIQMTNGYWLENPLGSGFYEPSWGTADFVDDEVPDNYSEYPPNSSFYYPPTRMPFKNSGKVTHGGSAHWLYLETGENVLELNADSGSGTAIVRFHPAWL